MRKKAFFRKPVVNKLIFCDMVLMPQISVRNLTNKSKQMQMRDNIAYTV